jgi:hypothetical protein
MKEEIEKLIQLYRKRVADLQKKQTYYENTNRGGACISLQGEIQAYNVILKDLRQIIYPS